jgi:hypothetical protein
MQNHASLWYALDAAQQAIPMPTAKPVGATHPAQPVEFHTA